MENEPRYHRRQKGVFFAIVLIVLGVVFLLERTGVIDRHLLSQWWPLLLIFAGAWLLVKRLGRRDD